jgi:hypothetical protein
LSQSPQFPQLTLLEHIVEVLKSMPRVRAAFIRGSFYSGQPDAYSDLDLYIVADNTTGEELIALGRNVLDATGRILWISVLDSMPPRLRALASGPLRIDLTIVTPTTLPRYEGWRILVDHDDLLRNRVRRAQVAEMLQPEHVLKTCDDFWWNLFNSISQLKRNQLWMALHLLDNCRNDLAQMMRWRRDPNRPFERFIDLERHLTAEDQQALAQTLAEYDLRGIVEALLCASDAFDPAARDVAARVGAEYPAAFAQFIKEFFIRELWALIATGPTLSA